MAEVKLPGSSTDVTAVAEDDAFSRPVRRWHRRIAAGKTNIISLAQRIRALHSDASSGNS